MIGVPAGLVMQIVEPDIEVFIHSVCPKCEEKKLNKQIHQNRNTEAISVD